MKWLTVVLLFLLALPSYSQGQGQSPNGPPGPIGNPNNPNQGNQGNQGQGQGQEQIQNLILQDPKLLVPMTARNASQLALPTSVSLSNLSIIRNVLLNNIGHEGREIGLWAAGHGDFVKEESTSQVTTAGTIVAADKRFCDHLVLGLAGGYSHSWSSSLDMNAGWGGGYSILFGRVFYINQAVIGGGDSFETTRIGLLGTAKANSAGWFFSEVTQAGYIAKLKHLSIGPYALLQYSLAGNGTFSENGSAAPVTAHSGSQDSIVSDLGIEASYDWKKLTFKTSAAWEHEYADTTTFTRVNLVGIPSSTTTVSGTSLGHDSAIVNAGLNYKVNDRIAVGVGYIGQFGRRNYESNSIAGSVKVGF